MTLDDLERPIRTLLFFPISYARRFSVLVCFVNFGFDLNNCATYQLFGRTLNICTMYRIVMKDNQEVTFCFKNLDT